MSWRARQKRIKTITHWDCKGAMAVKEGTKGFTAKMQLKQSAPDVYELSLYGPLGSGHVVLKGQGGAVTLIDNKKKIWAKNGQTLLKQQTGHTIPVNNLYYWLRGLPAPSPHAALSHDRYGHIVRIIQSGWRVDFLRYTSYKGIDLPSKLVMTYQNIKIKIVINKWGT